MEGRKEYGEERGLNQGRGVRRGGKNERNM